MNKLIQIALAGLVISQLHGCATAVVGAAATGGAVVLDRRSAGVFVSDQEIELRAQKRLGEALPKDSGRISTTSYNRQALLTGQVSDDASRTRAGEIVKEIPDVRNVFNELAVAGPTSLSAEANDTAITGKIKARLLRDEKTPATQIKIVTEATVVYLMGLVTQEEGKLATEIARTTSGVSKVVILFEYLN
ncbi:MAG: BON domain-containing protein [Thiobacillus sp.]|nr:BON domain-containing protein [Thiobacillus sp.]